MPIHGAEKIREMLRSVLPSTARKSARDNKQLLHGQERQRTRQAIRTADFQDPENFDIEPPHIRKAHAIKEIVGERRGADKVGPLVRWAERLSRTLPPQDIRSHFQALLPEGVIGEHALGHLRGIDGFSNDRYKHSSLDNQPFHPKAKRPLKDRKFLRLCCEHPRLHRALNQAILTGFPKVKQDATRQIWKCFCGYKVGRYSFGPPAPVHYLTQNDTEHCPTRKFITETYKVEVRNPAARHFRGLGDIEAFLALLKQHHVIGTLRACIDVYWKNGSSVAAVEDWIRHPSKR